MGKITVEGSQYKVTDKGCYNHDMGAYWKRVETPDGEKMVVGGRGNWRFWTAHDRTRPLREAMERGWTPEKGWPKGRSVTEGKKCPYCSEIITNDLCGCDRYD